MLMYERTYFLSAFQREVKQHSIAFGLNSFFSILLIQYFILLHYLLERLYFRFLDKDLAEYLRLKSSFHNSDKAHEEACSKLARVSKKNKSEKVKLISFTRMFIYLAWFFLHKTKTFRSFIFLYPMSSQRFIKR